MKQRFKMKGKNCVKLLCAFHGPENSSKLLLFEYETL